MGTETTLTDVKNTMNEILTLLDRSNVVEEELNGLKSYVQSIKVKLEESYKGDLVKPRIRFLDKAMFGGIALFQIVYCNRDNEILYYGDIISLVNGNGYPSLNKTNGGLQFNRVPIPMDEEIIEVYGGPHHFFLVPKVGNYLWTFGNNPNGMSGTGASGAIVYPKKVEIPDRPKYIFANGMNGAHTAIIWLENGRLYGAGDNSNGTLATGNNASRSTFGYITNKTFQKVKFAQEASLVHVAQDTNGTWYGWGNNTRYMLGEGISNGVHYNLVQINPGDNVKDVFVNSYHHSDDGNTSWGNIFWLYEDGTMKSVGNSRHHDLARNVTEWTDGSNYATNKLGLVETADGEPIKDCVKMTRYGAMQCQCILTKNGDLYTYGNGRHGFGDSRPAHQKSLPKKILSGVENFWYDPINTAPHYLVRMKDGTWKGWGPNVNSELGIEGTTHTSAKDLPLGPNIIDAMVGGYMLFVTDGKTVYASGGSGYFGGWVSRANSWQPIFSIA